MEFYFQGASSVVLLRGEAFLEKFGLQVLKPCTWTQMKHEVFGSVVSSLDEWVMQCIRQELGSDNLSMSLMLS